VPLAIITWVLFLLFKKTYSKIPYSNIILGIAFLGLWLIVSWKIDREFSKDTTEAPASWFGILNSFFIISLAPFFSKWWESKYNPSAGVKYGIGLILLGLGFAILAYGTSDIPQGAKTASVSMIFLILAYLLHTMGELCLSPVGLSYLSKLVPARMIGFMFGIWYLAIAIGQKAAGTMGGMIDKISEEYSISSFFLIFTFVPIAAGFVSIMLNPVLKKLMHGVK
jgi:POT family proton-dependent oligopeptide transporter